MENRSLSNVKPPSRVNQQSHNYIYNKTM